ncbi:hypothetical protein GSbR_22660 [Geobacter sp. SVR]|nr:hypothetical protein GSVR_21330 [Geobacter sp. SVR]GCF85666.1 hypothetical protein GSbR_22660 [Geobacter sp. SVR]
MRSVQTAPGYVQETAVKAAYSFYRMDRLMIETDGKMIGEVTNGSGVKAGSKRGG